MSVWVPITDAPVHMLKEGGVSDRVGWGKWLRSRGFVLNFSFLQLLVQVERVDATL